MILLRPNYSPAMAAFLQEHAGTPGCWICSFGRSGNGYAEVWAHRPDPERNRDYAHHAAYICVHGSIPYGLHIMHTCDVRRCCNPNHLIADTRLANIADCKAKMRHQHGIRHWQAKLTEDQIRAIRDDKRKLKYIAADYGIGMPAASTIRNRKAWKHVL